MKYLRIPCNLLLAGLLCLALRAFAFADVVNIAYATYNDASSTGTVYTSTSTTVDIVIQPVITSTLVATGVVGSSFSYTIIAINNPTSYSATPLPPGLTLSSNVISGIPTSTGTTNVTLSATNMAGTGTNILQITISAAPMPIVSLVKTASVTTAKKNDPITFTITYTNTGTGAASNLVIKDTVPQGTAVGTINNNGHYDGPSNTITWTIPGTVPAAGGSGSVSFQVTVQ